MIRMVLALNNYYGCCFGESKTSCISRTNYTCTCFDVYDDEDDDEEHDDDADDDDADEEQEEVEEKDVQTLE